MTETIIQSVADLKRLKTFEVKKELVGGASIEDWPAIVKECKEIAESEGISIEISDNKVVLDGCRTMLKPKLKRVSYGTITMRSNDYVFTDKETGVDSYGTTITRAMLTGKGFELETGPNSKLVYTLT